MATATVRGCELSHDLIGAGPALVWGHGLTGSRAADDAAGLIAWDDLCAANSVLRYDSRGHGESESTVGGYGWDELAQDQLELAAVAGIDSYVAGGASLGAATALHAAVAAPERIRGLVLMIPPTAWDTRAAQADRYELMASIVERKGVEPLIAAAADLPLADPFVDVPGVRERQAETLRAADPNRLATVFRGATGANFPAPEQVSGIEVPTLILAWTGDDGHPVSTADRLAELIDDTTVEVASTLDSVLGWSATIAGFLAGCR